MELEFIKIAIPLLAVGGAWGGAKAALNGTRNRVKEIEQDLEDHKAVSQAQHVESIDRLARIETKIDQIAK